MSMQLATPGIAKQSDLSTVELPPGMGSRNPITASAERYCGTLTLGPNDAFNFHQHPRQDEVIYVVDGSMEGWVEQENTTLGPGDVIVAPAGTVHACFNASDQPLKLFIVLSPLLPDVDEDFEMHDGYGWEMVDVSGEEPGSTLRQ